MKPFSYTRPESVSEAVATITPDVRPLAGGTDLLTLMKAGIQEPSTLVDIKRLPDIGSSIEQVYDEIEIGALTTLSELEQSETIQRLLPALHSAVTVAATPQLRNMATIGGNVLQRPRCWYFREEETLCWLKGGGQCLARDGENRFHGVIEMSRCVASHPSDLATVLLAYDAIVEVQDGDGRGEIPFDNFLQPPTDERRLEHTLPDDAIITGMRVPVPGESVRSVYLKAMDRKTWAFALAGVAAVLEVQGSMVADAKIVLGGVGPVPVRATEAEHVLLGTEIFDETITQAARAAVAGMTPLSDNGYKVPLIEGLVTRALRECCEDCA